MKESVIMLIDCFMKWYSDWLTDYLTHWLYIQTPIADFYPNTFFLIISFLLTARLIMSFFFYPVFPTPSFNHWKKYEQSREEEDDEGKLKKKNEENRKKIEPCIFFLSGSYLKQNYFSPSLSQRSIYNSTIFHALFSFLLPLSLPVSPLDYFYNYSYLSFMPVLLLKKFSFSL